MSEKIGLSRAEIVDLLSLILRTHSRDELFSLFRSAEGITPKEDPEAWREDNRKKQAAGVKFEKLWYDGFWHKGECGFTGKKEDYREVPQEVQKEIGVGIPEEARSILMAWQRSGLKFFMLGNPDPVKFSLCFDDMASKYTIPEQSIPEGMRIEKVEAMWQQGLKLEFDGNFGWDLAADGFDWHGIYRGAQLLARLRIPAQPIPEKLLEVPQPAISPESPEMRDHRISEAIANLARNYCADKGTAQLPKAIPHAAERALWKAQREAGTNEVWQFDSCSERGWIDIPIDETPNWMPNSAYRVKPMKLTARIVRNNHKFDTRVQDWQFFGTREEYRAECEKYGYVVVSNIEEVKPKMVKYYFALIRNKFGTVHSLVASSIPSFNKIANENSYVILGNIEEREIEA